MPPPRPLHFIHPKLQKNQYNNENTEFDPLRTERIDSSMEVEEESDNYVEPVIPWFEGWERMVKKQEEKVCRWANSHL